MSKTQEVETTSVPPTQATIPSSKPSDSQPSTAQQTLSPPTQSASSAGTDTAQAPKATSHHPTALVPSSSMTTKSSAMAETGPKPPKSSQNSSPQAEACALDEYAAGTEGCMCNHSYYAHSELTSKLMTLHCWPQDIEVALRSCFLETHHWVLRQGAFKGCFSTRKIEQGHRVHSFRLEKKKDTCGLHLSTNTSHALYSVEVQLEQVLPGSNTTDSRMLNFSCVYPLAVNVSQTLSNQVDSSPTIHIPSTGETIVTLSVFTDAQLSSSLKNRTAVIGTPLYVVLKSTNSDPGRFALVANEVFASTNLSKTGVKATYHFVNDSCPVGGRLLQDLAGNGVSLQVTLAFTLQRFLNSDTLYLHARVSLCDKQQGRSCQPTCKAKNPLRRSSPWEIRTPVGVEHGGRGEWIVFGPLRLSESKASSGRSSPGWYKGTAEMN
uniref:pancreatic secretory granule membrane major glycoprotein GP2-like n=1 Tax=Jaculus jaculus TaxID=51337 RepID=UPI001E1B22D9|nr:pancreatic secretory granule membrane major glycoprotein GP2-like [Jaculus jaculus]